MTIQEPVNPSFVAPILDLLPDAIIWVRPVINDSSEIEDFEVGYSNKTADEGINHPKGSLTGLRILKDGVPSSESAKANFRHFHEVYQSGEIKEHSFYAHHSNRHYETIRRPYEGGVLSTTRDRKAQREAERKEQETRQILQSIVESSPNGILLYDAIRDERNVISDFRIRHYNQRSNELTGYTAAQRESLTLRQILQGLDAEQFFDKYVEVVETGISIQREQHIATLQKWVSSSIVKLGDGFLAMLTDITELKLYQQSLQKESHFASSILNASLNGIYVLEAVRDATGSICDFVFIRCNQRFMELTGWPVERILGQSFLSLFPHTKETGLYNLLCRVIETDKSEGRETYYAKSFNRWYDYMAVQLDENNVVVTFQEITQQREAAIRIEQQKNLLDNILKHSSNGISVGEMIRDSTGRIVDIKTIIANDAASRFTGIPREVYLAKTGGELEPGFIGSPYFDMCVKAMETGEPFITQYFFEKIGRWLEVSVSKMDEEHQIYIFTDVTTIKEAQLAIERSEAQLQTIINRTQSGIFTFSPVKDENGQLTDFRFVMVNRALAAYVKHEPEALAGRLGSEWFSGYKTNGLFERFRDTYENGNMNRFDFHYNADGINAWIDILCTPFDGNLLVTFTDYTPVKLLQLEQQRLIEELKQSNQSLEEFAYAASHDLQEPLRKINTFSDRLQHELSEKLNDIQKLLFERIENAAQRMRNLIDDLLAFSQVSRKQSELEQVDLNVVVEAALLDLEARIQETGAVVSYESLPVIKGDERQLRQMLLNLIGNALKYRKPDIAPQVRVTCSVVQGKDTAYPMLSEQPDKNYYQITVADNGIGFEQEYAQSIFQVFHRLHGKSEYEGTGIGLAIVQRVAQNHNGYVMAEGTPGIGATFRVLLPV